MRKLSRASTAIASSLVGGSLKMHGVPHPRVVRGHAVSLNYGNAGSLSPPRERWAPSDRRDANDRMGLFFLTNLGTSVAPGPAALGQFIAGDPAGSESGRRGLESFVPCDETPRGAA